LHYNYFRDYDPRTGRYIESDPIGLAGGINTYAYAGSNPVVQSDRLGLVSGNDPPVSSPPSVQQRLVPGGGGGTGGSGGICKNIIDFPPIICLYQCPSGEIKRGPITPFGCPNVIFSFEGSGL
jgi:hypothetical protein